MMMTLEQGDRFEKESATWIREHLPTYEKLWSEFIGNDGTAHPLPLTNLPPEDEASRKFFYQAHYSMALSAKKIHEIMDGLKDVILASRADQSYERQFDLLFCLMARIGHVRDMVAKMDAALSMNGEAEAPLQGFYHMRSHLCHGPQMPSSQKDDQIHVPMIGADNPTASEWHDKDFWDKKDPETFVPLHDLCEKLVQEFFEILTSVHQKIYGAAKTKFSRCVLAQSPARPSNEQLATPSFSGCNISGQYWT